MLGIVTLSLGFVYYQRLASSLPDYQKLASYQPYVMTRLYAQDGSVLSEVAEQKRFFVPFSRIPPKLIQAFLAAEDKNFYTHHGVDFTSIVRAGAVDILNFFKSKGRRPIGASTITQQVAKNFFLTSKVSFERKLKEMILAQRLEKVLSKQKILELYLNQIYLGLGSYGVASAASVYFGVSVDQLSLAQMAYLAALPKAPNNYHPVRDYRRSLIRRNWVLERMYEDGFINGEELRTTLKEDLKIREENSEDTEESAPYFVEAVKKTLYEKYGRESLLTSGLTVYTTLDLTLQKYARQVLREGLIEYDRRQGYRGPIAHFSLSEEKLWRQKLHVSPSLAGDRNWKLAVVKDVQEDGASIVLEAHPKAHLLLKPDWGGKKAKLKPGDVVYVQRTPREDTYTLEQIPAVNGAMVVLDPHTGRLLAMEGGFSFAASQFNRATQAVRQPGSALKPIAFAAALEQGFTPASLVADTPLAIGLGKNQALNWRPRDYQNTFLGSIRLRAALEHSRNLATIHLVQAIGMPTIIRYVKLFGVQDNMPNLPSMALGAGETTLLRLAYAYAVFANGGLRVEPIFIDRIQNMEGAIEYRSDKRPCPGCNDLWQGQMPPKLPKMGQRIISEQTAYQITSMLEGAVRHGTGHRAKIQDMALAGKTGTTNQEKDAWFIGYSKNLLVGVFVGYDKPKPLGNDETGGRLAAPIFRQFMERAQKHFPGDIPFHIPDHIQFIKINKVTGRSAQANDVEKHVMFEAFREGTYPNDIQTEENALKRHNHYFVVDSFSGVY